MRHWKLQHEDKFDDQKTNDDSEKESTLRVASVHLNNQLANNQTGQIRKDDELKKFYNSLASAILKYTVRVVNGDFNMDTSRAMSELRARGLCVNVSAWFPWFKSGGEFHYQNSLLGSPQVQLDSVVIMVVGPNSGCRLPFETSVFLLKRHNPLSRSAVRK